MERRPYLLNADAVGWETVTHGATNVHEQHVSQAMRAHKLSFGITVLPPGARSYPFHFHFDNEEMFAILSGHGHVRYGSDTVAVRPGDVISCPAGQASAHQLINDGTEPLRYLAVGTTHTPDLMAYPDSAKVNIFAGSAAGEDEGTRTFSGVFQTASIVSYWEGEA